MRPVIGAKRSLEPALLAGGILRLIGLVEEALAEVDAAERVLIAHGNLVELYIGPGVLDVGLHQRSALLDRLDQNLLLPNGLLHERGLIRGQLVCRLVLGSFLCVRPGRPKSHGQEGKGDLSKHHVIS